jgi:hypothetical protein
VVLWNELSLTITTDGANNYQARLQSPQPAAVNPQAYFVAPNGSDSSAGTLTAPFLTWAHAQAAMEASSTIKTTYFRAGVYLLAQTYTGCGSSGAFNGLQLQHSTDSNTTFSYYPPDGIGSAIFDGQATMSGGGAGDQIILCITGTSSSDGPTAVSIIGLTFRNFQWSAIVLDDTQVATQNQNDLVKWNTVYNTTTTQPGPTTVGAGAIASQCYAINLTITGNYVFQVPSQGISAQGGCSSAAGNMNGLVVSGNIVEGCCIKNDGGGIYLQDTVTPLSTSLLITGNYLNSTQVNRGIDLDDGVSNATVTGNVVIAPSGGASLAACAFIHGGSSDVFEFNLCDLTTAPTNNTGPLTQQQSISAPTGMTGNLFKFNIVVCKTAGTNCGNGYGSLSSIPAAATVTANSYFNFGAGASVNTGGSGTATGDSNPTYQNPSVTCWNALVSPSSPVFNAPVSFQALPYAWGPPGLVGQSQSQLAPSWGPIC